MISTNGHTIGKALHEARLIPDNTSADVSVSDQPKKVYPLSTIEGTMPYSYYEKIQQKQMGGADEIPTT